MSHIHLFTSNHLEGWGAVVNEAMNSGCAEVGNSQVGAIPYLIKHKQNGLIYKEGSYEDFLACVLSLFEEKELHFIEVKSLLPEYALCICSEEKEASIVMNKIDANFLTKY